MWQACFLVEKERKILLSTKKKKKKIEEKPFWRIVSKDMVI